MLFGNLCELLTWGLPAAGGSAALPAPAAAVQGLSRRNWKHLKIADRSFLQVEPGQEEGVPVCIGKESKNQRVLNTFQSCNTFSASWHWLWCQPCKRQRIPRVSPTSTVAELRGRRADLQSNNSNYSRDTDYFIMRLSQGHMSVH